MSEPITLKAKKREQLSKDDSYGEQIRFFAQFSPDGHAVQEHLARAKVAVLGAGAIGSHALAALAEAGIGMLRLVDNGVADKRDVGHSALLNLGDVGKNRGEMAAGHINAWNLPALKCEALDVDLDSADEVNRLVEGTDCVAACADWPSPEVFETVNRAALRARIPWISAHLSGGAGIVGPTVIAGQTPCYACCEMRRKANVDNYEEMIQYETRLRQMPAIKREAAAPKPFGASLGALLAVEVLRLLSGVALPQTAGRIMRLEFFAPEITYHRFLRIPNCPACGRNKHRSVRAVTEAQ